MTEKTPTPDVADEHPHFTPIEGERVQMFVGDVIAFLHLRHVRVLLLIEPCHDSAWATIKMQYNKHVAELKLGAGWMEMDEDAKREALVHECCHILLKDQETAIVTQLQEDRDVKHHSYRAFKAVYYRQCELFVDRITHVLIERLTFPWPDDERLREAGVPVPKPRKPKAK